MRGVHISPEAFTGHMDSKQDLVQINQVEVVFDGFKALDINYFGVNKNELRVVIGPNGAGKTTLCDVISGKTKVTKGKVFFDEHEISGMRDTDIAELGVGRKFQTPTVFDSLTVYENMEVALPGRCKVLQSFFAKRRPEESERILHLLERVRLLDDLHTEAKYLSHGQRQWLEISMLMVAKPKLLLVDEPAAGLTDKETELTADLLSELKGDHTIIVIEHDMDFVRRLDSRVTVLNEGKILSDGTIDQVSADEAVIEAYLGR